MFLIPRRKSKMTWMFLILSVLLAVCGCATHTAPSADATSTAPTTPAPSISDTGATVSGFAIKAIGTGDVATVTQELAQNANVNGADPDGFTPLMWASFDGQAQIVKLFLDKGANVNAKDKYDRTPLMEAAFRQDNPAVPLLLAKSADVSAKDDHGDTALAIAEREDNQSVVAELKKAGAK